MMQYPPLTQLGRTNLAKLHLSLCYTQERYRESVSSKAMTSSQMAITIARPPHEPPAILSCTPGLAGYPYDPTQLWHGWLLAD